jgi:YidC/Oxa1 family membrane protein insertase
MMNRLVDYARFGLYAVLIVIGMLLFQQWQQEHTKTENTQTVSPSLVGPNYVPQVAAPVTNQGQTQGTSAAVNNPVATTVSAGKIIHITTDVLSVDIDTQGGNIVRTALLKYPQELHSTQAIVLLNDQPTTRYLAQSGLLSSQGPDTTNGQAIYTTDQTDYSFDKDQSTLQVNLYWKNDAGLKVTKTYSFKRNSYEVGLNYQIENQSSQAWDGNIYLQLLRTNTPPAGKTGLSSLATYFGAAISSPDKQFEKITFKSMAEKNIDRTITGGWVAMIQHYFVSAWVPDKDSVSQYYTRVSPNSLYTVGTMGPSLVAKPGQQITTQAKFYAGPESGELLEKVAPGLKLTIDYGWFWFISVIIFWMMEKIYNVIGNWGWSIVLVTVIIKLLFYQLSAKSYRSMNGLKKLQPKIEMLKERYGQDKQKFTQATLELYKKEKVNPMGGCLPIIIQIPVFIALYWVLVESVELRQAPFMLWIHDLSMKDPYYVLPLLMGVSMFLQQRLSPPPPDPTQAKVLMFMPVIFTVLFLNFPAGLMLYWFVNNILSFAQQWYIMKTVEKAHNKKGK